MFYRLPMKQDFNEKLPTFNAFLAGMYNLWYTKDDDSDKKIIQYIFKTIENYSHKTKELEIGRFSLEHISPQSNKKYKDTIGMIGNLLPLAQPINEEADTEELCDKLSVYGKSKLIIVQTFLNEYKQKEEWTDEDIKNRTKKIAELSFNTIWNI